jgi:hypothetical protein
VDSTRAISRGLESTDALIDVDTLALCRHSRNEWRQLLQTEALDIRILVSSKRTKTKKSAVSRYDNNNEDVRLFTLEYDACSPGRTLKIESVGICGMPV